MVGRLIEKIRKQFHRIFERKESINDIIEKVREILRSQSVYSSESDAYNLRILALKASPLDIDMACLIAAQSAGLHKI